MNIAKLIDQTMLKPEATTATIKQICSEARENHFCAVVVNSCHVKLVKKELEGSDVQTGSAIGFPLGAMSTSAKAFETKQAVEDGATEIDMVINIGAIKDNDFTYVKEDIQAVVEAAKPAIVKVVLETCLLNEEEIVKACEVAVEAGAKFVKTSTGFSTKGATVENVRLMKKTVGNRAKVKASGGINTPEFAQELIDAGADRIGSGNGMALI